jgi:hypothetical protein
MVALFSQRGEQEGLHACWIYCCEEERERDEQGRAREEEERVVVG